jgi:hypothetical protein
MVTADPDKPKKKTMTTVNIYAEAVRADKVRDDYSTSIILANEKYKPSFFSNGRLGGALL